MRRTIITFFVVATGVWLNLAIPPFQNPDEPQHFAAAVGFAQQGDARQGDHAGLIRFMDRNHWWRFIGIGRADPLPERLEQIDFLMGYYSVKDFTLHLNDVLAFHYMTSRVMRVAARSRVDRAYYIARLISFLFFIGALWIVSGAFWKTTGSDQNPERSAWTAAGFYIILFLPQFLLTSISVNPDTVSIFLGTLFFAAGFTLVRNERIVSAFIALFAIAILGAILDRSNYFMLPACGLAVFFSFTRKTVRRTAWLCVGFVGILASSLLAARFLFPGIWEKMIYFGRANLPHGDTSLPALFSFDALNKAFFLGITDSFLIKFGWSAFSVSPVFYPLWRTLIGIAILGIAVLFSRIIFKKRRPARPKDTEPTPILAQSRERSLSNGRLIGFSLSAIVLQIMAVRMITTQRNLYAQGRYLFPLILPIAILLIVGWKYFFDSFDRKKRLGAIAVKIFVLLEFLFLNYAIWNDVIPVFHITLRSPRPGA